MFCFQLFIENVSYSIPVASRCMWQHHGQFMRLRCVCYMCHLLPAKHGDTFFSLIYNAFEIIRNLNIHFILKGAFNFQKCNEI